MIFDPNKEYWLVVYNQTVKERRIFKGQLCTVGVPGYDSPIGKAIFAYRNEDDAKQAASTLEKETKIKRGAEKVKGDYLNGLARMHYSVQEQ